MSYSIQNKLCDDVLGLVKSFRGKTQKEILFSECLEDINNNENIKDYLREEWESMLHTERFTRKSYETSYISNINDDGSISKNGNRKYTTHTYLFTQDGTQIR
tara:strand:- start:126 stop:434 length:309 start_codon:yes stop_codon:yes gene_type:complete